ncbi:MAG: YciI family protein [Alphaproteobacteria bacterium]
MQFLIIAYDYTDPDALNRRMAVREQHLALADANKHKGHAVYGIAILDSRDKMIGSVMVMDYPNREALEEWLKDEPYVTGRVWKDISVQACRVGPTFIK